MDRNKLTIVASDGNPASHRVSAARNFVPPACAAPLLVRRRLLDLLNDGTTARVTLLLAPGGYGKSTLIAQWREDLLRRNARVAWLTLQPTDRGEEQFVISLSRSLDSGGLSLASSGLLDLDKTPDLDAPAAFRALLAQVEASAAPWILILDAYECAACAPVDRLLEMVIGEMPDNMHLAVASRVRPNISLARYEMRGLTREIGSELLQLSREEVAAIFTPHFSPKEISLLAERAEGWPVVLQLAHLWVNQGHGTPHDLAKFSGRTRQMASYLAQEILATVPEDVRNFLVDVSVLTRIDADAADAVRNATDSSRLLAAAVDLQPLLVELENERGRFRLHALFAEFLRDLLDRKGAEYRGALFLRASSYFERTNDIVEAVRCACLGRDPMRGARIAADAGGIRIFIVSGIGKLRTILSLLPSEAIDASPRLQLGRALLLMKEGHVKDGWQLFERVKASAAPLMDSSAEEAVAFAIDVKVIEAIYATYRSVVLSPSYVEELQALAHRARSTDPLVAGILMSFLASSHQQQGMLDLAERTANEARRYYLSANSEYPTAFLQLHYALIDFARGNLHAAERRLNIALRLTQHRFRADTGLGTMVKLLSAEARYERNDVAGAMKCLSEALEKTNLIEGWFDFYAAGYVTAARIAFARDGLESAIKVLDGGIERSRDRSATYFWRILTAWKVTFYVLAGNLERAVHLSSEFGLEPSVRAAASHWRERDAVGLAVIRTALAATDGAGARCAINDLRLDINSSGRRSSAIRLQVLDAALSWSEGDRPTAIALLRDAIVAAHAENLVRIFTDEGRLTAPMLSDLLPEIACTLEGPAASFSKTLAPSLKPSMSQDEAQVLSPREYEVLTQLASGKSNKVIARELGLSERTVKFHLGNLYEKLGVCHRSAAVIAGRELGLLP